MQQKIVQEIIEKAKTKKDGVYSLKGARYAVRNGTVQFMTNYGVVYQLSYGFLVTIGGVDRYNETRELKRLMEEVK